MNDKQVDKILEAINEGVEAQNIILLRIVTTLERIEITLKLMAATRTQPERKPDNDDVASTGEESR
jgi:hypothetical protein